jgi:hypothetical protein
VPKKKKKIEIWGWAWCMPVILILRRQRHEDHLGNSVRKGMELYSSVAESMSKALGLIPSTVKGDRNLVK